ncbi:hypothetical protein Ahy_A04g018602 [Arachis hypogaea]|uniref:Aminotransferase-like plant mobile domain-containing protein n=1 Tax=Arachis hypogaea TaxID=3818 RepID=A0A445DE15_ARAHY|nr:hypothetical protein Ahy_A04g018602 [Arachis hypogaea]
MTFLKFFCPMYQVNKNLLLCKFDPLEMWQPTVDQVLRTTGFHRVSRVGQIGGHFVLLYALVEKWRSGLIFSYCQSIKDTQPLDTWESVQRYVRCHIFCLLETTLFVDKSTAYAHAKYLPLLQNFEQISTNSWGSATLTHLYRSLCRALQYHCKEIDDSLDLLFVWTWERMPFLVPIPRQQFAPANLSVARSHHPLTRAWMSRSAASIKHDIDYMDETEWFASMGMHSPPLPAQAIPLDQHCYTLRGVQCYDWSIILYHHSKHHSLPHRQQSHLGLEFVEFLPFSPQADTFTDDALIHRFIASGGPVEEALIPAVPSQSSSQSHRRSVDSSSRQSHRTPTPDS